MNTKNNSRKRESRSRMEHAFVELLQEQALNRISVSDICKLAQVNRSTFYANYEDIFQLADVVQEELEKNISVMYREQIQTGTSSNDFTKLFQHISENPMLYQTYFKLGGDHFKIMGYDKQIAEEHFGSQNIEYHMEFFKGGITAIIKKWLDGGCKESPEEIQQFLRDEYRGRKEFFEKKKSGKA